MPPICGQIMVKDDANIVNFATFRKKAKDAAKAKARQDKEAEAQANRIRFGRSGADKKRDKALTRKEAEKLEGHKRETPEDEGEK